jgi:hypothetical protein
MNKDPFTNKSWMQLTNKRGEFFSYMVMEELEKLTCGEPLPLHYVLKRKLY